MVLDTSTFDPIIKKNRNASPSIKEALERISKIRMMSIVGVVAAFNTVRIKEGHEETAAFMAMHCLFEYVFMPFRLCNAPGTVQVVINEVLYHLLDKICTTCLNDVLICN